jgi:hypothetical protein
MFRLAAKIRNLRLFYFLSLGTTGILFGIKGRTQVLGQPFGMGSVIVSGIFAVGISTGFIFPG